MKFIEKVFGKEVTDEEILSAIGAWMLCCAVGAYTKTLSTSGTLDFDTWFRWCRDSWIPKVKSELGISESKIKSVLLRYAKDNSHRSYMEVYEAEKTIHPAKR